MAIRFLFLSFVFLVYGCSDTTVGSSACGVRLINEADGQMIELRQIEYKTINTFSREHYIDRDYDLCRSLDQLKIIQTAPEEMGRLCGERLGDIIRISTDDRYCIFRRVLIHELAHHFENHLEGVSDPNHETWRPRGICRAVGLSGGDLPQPCFE